MTGNAGLARGGTVSIDDAAADPLLRRASVELADRQAPVATVGVRWSLEAKPGGLFGGYRTPECRHTTICRAARPVPRDTPGTVPSPSRRAALRPVGGGDGSCLRSGLSLAGPIDRPDVRPGGSDWTTSPTRFIVVNLTSEGEYATIYRPTTPARRNALETLQVAGHRSPGGSAGRQDDARPADRGGVGGAHNGL